MRLNLKEYQRSLDRCEMTNDLMRVSPSLAEERVSVRRSTRRQIKKKDISSPGSLLHVSGAKMVDR